MAYSDKVWKNAPDYTTPLSAAGLNDWEARIKAETDALSVLAESTAADLLRSQIARPRQGVVDLIEPAKMNASLTLSIGSVNGSSYGSPVLVRWDNPIIKWVGGTPQAITTTGYGTQFGGIVNPETGGASRYQTLAYACVDIYDSDFELYFDSEPGTFRIFIDGQPHVVTPTNWPGTAGSRYYLKVANLPRERDRYRVMVELNGSHFGGFNVRSTASIEAPIGVGQGGAVLIIGDSYSVAEGLAPWTTYAMRMARRLGFDRVYIMGQGGTGMAVGHDENGGTNGYKYLTRLTADRALIPDDVVLIFNQGSTNDGNFSTAPAITTAANALLDYQEQQWPNARIVMSSTLRCKAPTANDLVASAAYKAVAAARSEVIYIDQIAGAWFTGTGTSAAPAGDGTADYLIQSDASHPTSAGQREIGDRLANAVATAIGGQALTRTVVPRTLELSAPPPNVAVESMRRREAVSAYTMASGVARLAYFQVYESIRVSTLEFVTTSGAGLALGGATLSKLRYGLWSVDASTGDLTLSGSTAHDAALLAATGTAYPKALSTAVTLVPGTLYAVAPLIVLSGGAPTFPTICAVSVNAGLAFLTTNQRPRLTAFVTGLTDLGDISAASLASVATAPYCCLAA